MSRARTFGSRIARLEPGALATSIAVVVLASLPGVAVRPSNLGSAPNWYEQLDKPDWTPPNEFFAPVWGVMYLIIAIAAWRIWRRRHDTAIGNAMLAYAIQLALNMLWTPIFFGLRSPEMALACILALGGVLVWCVVEFKKVNAFAALLMSIYFCWIGIATALTFSIVARN